MSFDAALRDLKEAARWPDEGDITTLFEPLHRSMVVMLSGDLAAHVCGITQLTAVDRSCLVRKATQEALSSTKSLEDDDTSGTDSVSLRLLDALYSDRHGGNLGLAESIVQAVRFDAESLGAAQQRKSMASRLSELAPACEADGAHLSIILLATLHLVRVGTPFTRPLAPRTISEYASLSVRRIAAALAPLSGTDLSTIDWLGAVYEPILADASVEATQRGKLAAALVAFHDVVVSVVGVARLGRSLSPELPSAKVSANVIWPHEIDACFRDLQPAADRDRLYAQALAVFAILAGAACRIEDVFHIHVFGVRSNGTSLTLFIDPLPSTGDGKTFAARRPIEIADARAVALLEAWVSRRLEEGATPRDLLFGDPDDGRRPFRPGASQGLINATLKGMTGEAMVGSHELRHTFLSMAHQSLSVFDQRRFDSMSAGAGHEWGTTTLQSYCHLYEKSLRSQLDAYLSQIHLTERAACELGQMRFGTLRKRWERAEDDAAQVTWRTLRDAAGSVVLPKVSEGFETRPPATIPLLSCALMTFGKVFSALQDWAAGHSPHAIKLRHSIGDDEMEALRRTVARWRTTQTRSAKIREPSENGLPWGTSWARADQPKWLTTRRALIAATADRLRPVVDSWLQIATPQHLTLDDVTAAFPLLQELAKAGLSGQQIVLHHEPETDFHEAFDLIASLFGKRPTLVQTKPRRGRSDLYLSVASSCRDDTPPSSAATGIAGLHVLLFSSWVWTQLAGGSHE